MAEMVMQELGSKLESHPPSKGELIELLEQGEACLREIKQAPSSSVMASMQPLMNAIVKPEVLKHQDHEVNLLVASCISEILRITVSEARPYEDNVLKDVFQLIVSTFKGLSDVNDPSFGRRVVILETMAKFRSCVMMLDLECEDLINETFKTFFAVARDEHPENVLTSMQTIMGVLLDECEGELEGPLNILLSILDSDKEDVTVAARRLAMNVKEKFAAELEPNIVISMKGLQISEDSEKVGGSREAMSSTSKAKIIVLKSSDEDTFEVEEVVALQSQTIKHIIEDDCADGIIPIPNITSDILSVVIDYCRAHVAEADEDKMKAFDAEFVNVDKGVLFELILAANYLNIKSLLDLTCQTVADMIKGKTPEEIRETFGIENDFSPEEEEMLRKENSWKFE